MTKIREIEVSDEIFKRREVGFALNDFDTEIWSDENEDCIIVDENSSFIHSLSYGLIGEVEDMPIEEFYGAIDELSKINVSKLEPIAEIKELQIRIYELIRKEFN